MTVDATGPDAAAVGRRRRLLRLAGPGGIVAGIAIDHRDSFRVALERRGLAGLDDGALRELKLRLARVLAPAATAIMLDAELGIDALVGGVVPSTIGLIMPLEAQGYEAGGDDRTTSLMTDFSPADAARFGADACKLLVPYRADQAATAARQDAVVASAARACHALGLPLVVEPLVYRRSTESDAVFAAAYEGLVVGAVERLVELGPDLLKLPFPLPDLAVGGEEAASAACRRLHDACHGTPWVLLGAGVATGTFVDQVRLAGGAGASGFLAGRGIWGVALVGDPTEVERLAAGSALADLERCRAEAERHARPLDGRVLDRVAGEAALRPGLGG